MKNKIISISIIGFLLSVCLPILNAGAIIIEAKSDYVDIECNDCYEKICSGQTAGFTLFVTNMGDFNDTFDIVFLNELDKVSDPFWYGYTVKFSQNNVTLEPGESIKVYCNVTIYDYYSGVHDIVIGAVSRTNTSVIDWIHLYVDIYKLDVHISALGGISKLDVIVENTGDLYLSTLEWKISVKGIRRDFIDVSAEGTLTGMWTGRSEVISLPRGSIKNKFGFVRITVTIKEQILGRNPLVKSEEFYGLVIGRFVKILPYLPGPRPIMPFPGPIID